MTFAKEYQEEITFGYYVSNFVLTIILFAIGSWFWKRRERRDQRRKEWRDFAETIRKEHNELKGKNIPSNIAKVKNAFEKIHIYEDIKGTGVLRFMMRNPDYQSFKTEKLDALREDLDSVYGLLNRCASLILLGPVPENVKAEPGQLVTNLAQLTRPFYKGEERNIILECRKHFGRVGNETSFCEEAKKEMDNDEKIEQDVPYVHLFRFVGLTKTPQQHTQSESYLKKRDDGQCSKFRFYFPTMIQPIKREQCAILQHSHFCLESHPSVFANKLREQAPKLNFIDKICESNPDEMVIAKALHEIRVYVHLLTEGKPLEGERSVNINILNQVCEDLRSTTLYQDAVKMTCGRFIEDLARLQGSTNPYFTSKDFYEELLGLYDDFIRLQNTSRPSQATV